MTPLSLPLVKLVLSEWFSGPKFLWDESFRIGSFGRETFPLKDSDKELRSVSCHSSKVELESITRRFQKFSTWKTLIRAIARLKSMIRRRSWKLELLSTQELEDAERFILVNSQSDEFFQEIRTLQTGNAVRCNSPLAKLSPFLEDGLLRVGGRSQYSEMLSKGEKNPIKLPRYSHVIMFWYY